MSNHPCPTCQKPLGSHYAHLDHPWLFYCHKCGELYRMVDGLLRRLGVTPPTPQSHRLCKKSASVGKWRR